MRDSVTSRIFTGDFCTTRMRDMRNIYYLLAASNWPLANFNPNTNDRIFHRRLTLIGADFRNRVRMRDSVTTRVFIGDF